MALVVFSLNLRSDGRFGRKIKRSLSVEYELMKHIEWKAR